jgi:RimJ/RimL family protein N-acetyltransferase
MKIELRKPLLSDAKRYFEILNHPEFYYFPAKPASVKAERDFLRGIKKRIAEGTEYSFAVMLNGKHVGGAGITMHERIPYKCEVGYFIAREHWGKGIATEAVRLLEEYIAENLDVVRIAICMAKGNVGSQRVAIKSGYKKEGLMKKHLKLGDKYHDSYLYAKIVG